MDPLQNGQLLDLSNKVSEIRNLALNIGLFWFCFGFFVFCFCFCFLL